MHKVEVFLSYFGLKVPVITFSEFDVNTLKILSSQNQNVSNDLKEVLD